MSTLPNIAVAGASGHLGSALVNALASSTFRSSFGRIITLSRSTIQLTENWIQFGVESVTYSEETLPASLEGIDIVVSAIGPTGHHFKDTLLKTIAKSQVSVYFPSEFGVDHSIHDFPHAEWGAKKVHTDLAKSIAPQLKVCRIFIGLLLEDSIGPWFGFDTTRGKYEAVGSSDKMISFTAYEDAGKALAALARLPIEQIPNDARISGDASSIRLIAKTMSAAGAGDIDVTCIDLKSFKEDVLAEGRPTPERYLRFLMGEGKIDYSTTNLNELANPSQSLWIWKSVADLAKETGGKPWADA